MSATIRSNHTPVPNEKTRVVEAAESKARASTFPFLRLPQGPGEIGRLGNYRVIRLLGSGGMGKVFLAEDLTLRRSVALKVMCLPVGEDLLNGWERFLREARALAAINHPNLVTVYQTGQDHGTIFLAMELLEGETLESRIRREAPHDVTELIWIAEQIATGLAAIHERGLIHRDIKPSNIWLSSTTNQDTEPLEEKDEPVPQSPAVAQVKILDFGLVREVNGDTQLTEAGVVVGTPAYMSPEQTRGRSLDHRSDLFSFGCVLYAMATGRPPFEASTPIAQAVAIAAEEPVRARKINPKIPASLSELIAELLAKNPHKRPASAADVVDRLRQIRSRNWAHADPRSRATRLRHTLIAVVAVVWLVAAGMLILAFSHQSHSQDVKETAKPNNPPAPEPAVDYLNEVQQIEKHGFPPPGAPFPPGVDGTVRVGGEVSPHGIFMHGSPPFHPPSFTSYALEKKYRQFITDVAINDTAHEIWGEVIFTVLADGKVIWRSENFSQVETKQHCELDVTDVRVLTLSVQIIGPEKGSHGVWIEPRLSK